MWTISVAIWNGSDGLEGKGGEDIEGKQTKLKKNKVGKQVKLRKNKLEREQSLEAGAESKVEIKVTKENTENIEGCLPEIRSCVPRRNQIRWFDHIWDVKYPLTIYEMWNTPEIPLDHIWDVKYPLNTLWPYLRCETPLKYPLIIYEMWNTSQNIWDVKYPSKYLKCEIPLLIKWLNYMLFGYWHHCHRRSGFVQEGRKRRSSCWMMHQLWKRQLCRSLLCESKAPERAAVSKSSPSLRLRFSKFENKMEN